MLYIDTVVPIGGVDQYADSKKPTEVGYVFAMLRIIFMPPVRHESDGEEHQCQPDCNGMPLPVCLSASIYL